MGYKLAIDLHTGKTEVSGGVIPATMVERWKGDGPSQSIAQAEAFALLLARRVYKPILMNQQITFYIDEMMSLPAMLSFGAAILQERSFARWLNFLEC